MTINSISNRGQESEGTGQRRGEGPPDEVVDRLAELLVEDVLEDALKGFSAQEITGPGGFLEQAHRPGDRDGAGR